MAAIDDLDDRSCNICGGQVPYREGLYYAPYGLFIHGRDASGQESSCSLRVKSVERDYSNSTRGRWRTKSAAMRLLKELAAAEEEVPQA